VALLSAVSSCFALGEATLEQFKHLAAADAGPLAGLGALPDLRTIRPELADRTDPVAVQRLFASAMLAADPVLSGVYYVDDHFVPYAGAKPVAKGWNNKRGKADRGGAYAQVFRHCRDQQAHWVIYRRAPLAVPAMLPVITTITVGGKARQVTWAEETTDIKDYGQARQITLFEHGAVALQILTSDLDACPADILAWLKSRWREENFLEYASENYGTDKIGDYIASISANTKVIDNPARKKANAAVREAEKALADAERGLAALLAGPAITPAAKNTRLIPAAQQKSPPPAPDPTPRRPATRSPPSCPPTSSTPKPRSRCCAPDAAACRWCCDCSRTTPNTGCQTSSTPTCATTTNIAPSPAKPSSAAWPPPSPTPPRRSPSSSTGPALPASPAPWPRSSTRSTPPRPPCPATSGPSPTSWPSRPRLFKTRATARSGTVISMV